MRAHKKGDLVHIPQAVTLIDCDNHPENDPQLTIPLRVKETEQPIIGVVASSSDVGGYVTIYCNGAFWSVKKDSVYAVSTESDGVR